MYFRGSEHIDDRTSTFEKVAAATSNFSAVQKDYTFSLAGEQFAKIFLKLHLRIQ
jgi:hypothetical protein